MSLVNSLMAIDELRLETIKACNYACVHCYTEKHSPARLSTSRMLELIDEAAEVGAKSVSLTGGEPLIDAKLVLKIARRAQKLGLKVRLNTNAHLVGKSCEAHELLEVVDEVQVSYHSTDSTRFDAFVQHVGAHARVTSALRALCAAKASAVSVRFSLTPDNFEELLDVCRLANAVGVKKIKIRTYIPPEGMLSPSSSAREQMRATIAQAMEFAEKHSQPLEIHAEGLDLSLLPTAWVHFPQCTCGKSSVFVSADGDVFPCVFVRERPEFSIGSVVSNRLERVLHASAERFYSGGSCTAAQVGTKVTERVIAFPSRSAAYQ